MWDPVFQKPAQTSPSPLEGRWSSIATRFWVLNRLLRFGMIAILVLAAAAPGPLMAGTVTDQLGRQVHVPENPRRIVALAPNITEILFALELSDRLVGATQFSDYPIEAARLPKVGSYVRLDVEKIVALEPDLCLAVKDGNPIAAVSQLESLNIPVYAVDPRNLGAVMGTLLELGELLDARSRARAIVAAMETRIAAVQRQVSSVSHPPAVFFQIGISPIVSVGSETFIHELIVMAGGRNLAQGRVPYPRFSKEQVIALRPEVIIITSMTREAVFEEVKSGWQQWQHMPAAKNGRIHLVDSNVLDRATPRLVDGLELLARLIHPDRFPEAQPEPSHDPPPLQPVVEAPGLERAAN